MIYIFFVKLKNMQIFDYDLFYTIKHIIQLNQQLHYVSLDARTYVVLLFLILGKVRNVLLSNYVCVFLFILYLTSFLGALKCFNLQILMVFGTKSDLVIVKSK